jgi:hypothetical protein
MKYIGKKSLSSFLSTALYVVLFFMLVGAVIFGTIVIINLFDISPGDPLTTEIAKIDMSENGENLFLFFDWDQIITWPLVGKIIFIIVFTACVIVWLWIIKSAQRLFSNFKNDILFDNRNVQIISRISKLFILFSIFTWSIGMLLISIFLLILCQIFKHGITLQEEHDLTV